MRSSLRISLLIFPVLALLILLNAPIIQAGETVSSPAFGDSLMLQKRYREAELEYERQLFAHPDQTSVLAKMLNAAIQTGDYQFSLSLSRTWEMKISQTVSCLPSFYVSESLYRLGNYERVLSRPMGDSCSNDLKAQQYYLRGLSDLWLWQWKQGAEEFQRIPENSSVHEAAVRGIRASEAGQTLHRRSPGVAMALSGFLPGAGYLYAHRPQTAFAALVVNGLFIGSTYVAAHQKEPELAALLGLFSFGWYFGGVSGASRATERDNHERQAALIHPLEDEQLPIGGNHE